MKISYMSEHTEFLPYSLDIYLGEWHLAIEIDGPTHSRARDRKRDVRLFELYGVPVLHVTTEFVEDVQPEEIKHAIMAFVNEYASTAKERKSAWLSR